MNNSGKSNVIFLLLIPIFFVVALIVVDTIFSYSQNRSFKSITESIISDVMKNTEIDYEDYYEEIKKSYEKYGYETDSLVVDASSYDVYVENEHSYFGIFSSLSNKKNIESEIKIFGITFKVKENSVARLKVNVRYNYDNELEFEYTE